MSDDKPLTSPEKSETDTTPLTPTSAPSTAPEAPDGPPAWFQEWQAAQAAPTPAPAAPEPKPDHTPVGSKVMKENPESVPDWYRKNTDLSSRVNHLVKEGWRFASAGDREGFYCVSPDGEYHKGKTLAIIVDGAAEMATVRAASGGTVDVEALLNPLVDTATAEALGIA